MSASEDYLKEITAELARKEAEKKALVEEFTKSIPLEWTPEDLKEKFRTMLASAYARIRQTIDSDNEALAFKAAQYAMNVGIGQIVIKDENDPNKEFTDLLKSMTPKTEEQKILDKVIAEHKHEVSNSNTEQDATTPDRDSK